MIEIQEFDLADCPYQINNFIKTNSIRKAQILSFSHTDKTVIMYYRPD